MAQSLNKVFLIGRVGREPEMKFAQYPVCKFSVATTESYKDKTTGEWKDVTDWHNVVALGALAEAIKDRIHKGLLVFVEGRVSNRSWVDQTGQKKYITEIRADKIQNLSPRTESAGNYDSYTDQTRQYSDQQVHPQPPKPPIGQGGFGSQAEKKYGNQAANSQYLGSSNDPNSSYDKSLTPIQLDDDYSDQDFGDPLSNYNGIDNRSKLDE